MRSINLAVLLLAGALTTGCAATVAADAYGPDLVYVSPGVQVIADYGEPIFYSDGFYWRYAGGVWYRSTYYTGGWVYARPPVAVLSINQPYAYRYYRPAGWRGRGHYAGPPPASSGWRGRPTTAAPPPAAGWRGNAPPAAARRPPPSYAPQPARPAPPPARGGQGQHGGGWRGNHR